VTTVTLVAELKLAEVSNFQQPVDIHPFSLIPQKLQFLAKTNFYRQGRMESSPTISKQYFNQMKKLH
jgi:hypothetical protein